MSTDTPQQQKHFYDSPPIVLGTFLGILATVLFAMKAIFVKLIYQYDVDYSTLISLRMLFAFPFYLLVLVKIKFQEKWVTMSLPQWVAVLLLGVSCYYLASVVDLYGMQFISASLERFIIYLYPTIVVLLSWVFFKKRITLWQIICIILAYVGLLLILLEQEGINMGANYEMSDTLIGVCFVFLSAVIFAFYMVFSERVILAVGSQQFTSIGMMAACLAVMVHQWAVGIPMAVLAEQPWEVYGLTLMLAFFSTVVPSLVMAEAIKLIGANLNALLGFSGPVFTLILAYLILGEWVTPLQMLGMVVILMSLSLMKWPFRS